MTRDARGPRARGPLRRPRRRGGRVVRRARGRDGGAARRERRRQDDDAERDRRAGAGLRRRDPLPRRGDRRPAGARGGSQRARAVAGGLAAVRAADGGEQSPARRHGARRPAAHPPTAGAGLHPVPPPRRAPAPARRHYVRRRAADARARPRADERPGAADAGRAEPRPRAGRRRIDGTRRWRRCTGRGSRCCSPSSRWTSRSTTPKRRPCCRSGVRCSPAPPRRSRAIRKCGESIWGLVDGRLGNGARRLADRRADPGLSRQDGLPWRPRLEHDRAAARAWPGRAGRCRRVQPARAAAGRAEGLRHGAGGRDRRAADPFALRPLDQLGHLPPRVRGHRRPRAGLVARRALGHHALSRNSTSASSPRARGCAGWRRAKRCCRASPRTTRPATRPAT